MAEALYILPALVLIGHSTISFYPHLKSHSKENHDGDHCMKWPFLVGIKWAVRGGLGGAAEREDGENRK